MMLNRRLVESLMLLRQFLKTTTAPKNDELSEGTSLSGDAETPAQFVKVNLFKYLSSLVSEGDFPFTQIHTLTTASLWFRLTSIAGSLLMQYATSHSCSWRKMFVPVYMMIVVVCTTFLS